MQSIVSARGQTVVPKEIRQALGIKPGARIEWVLTDGQATVFALPDDPVRALRGLLKGFGTYAEWLKERNEDRSRERELEEAEQRRWQAKSSTPQR